MLLSLRSRRLAALLLTAGLLTAGCADAPGSSARADGGTVRLGYSAWPGWFPWKVAEEQGFFEDNGVAVELTYFDSYTDSINALNTGNLDANSQTLNDTLASVSGGAEQTVVLTNDNSTGNDAIIAAPGITSVAQLKGKRVAAEQGTVDHFLLLLALEEAGLTEEDVEFTPLLTDAAAAAFVSGRVDAVGVFAPFTTTALSREGSTVLASSEDFPGAISDHLVFDEEFVEANGESVQGVVDAWFDALAWIADNRDAAVKTMAEQGGVTPAEYAEYDAGTTILTKEQNLAAFAPGDTAAHLDHQARVLSDFLTSTGLAEQAPDLDGLFDETFVEASE